MSGMKWVNDVFNRFLECYEAKMFWNDLTMPRCK